MRLVKYKGKEIPVISYDSVVRFVVDLKQEPAGLNYDTGIRVNSSNNAYQILELKVLDTEASNSIISVISNLENEYIIFEINRKFVSYYITHSIISESIVNNDNIIYSFKYDIVEGDLDFNAISRCLKIQNLLKD